MTQEIEQVEGSEIVVSEAPKTALVMSEKKALACVEKVRKAGATMLENLRILAEGQAWIVLGYENWDEMCYGEFGYESSTSRKKRALAYLNHDVSGLLQSGEALSILNRMPDDALTELKPLVKDSPEIVTAIVEGFASENVIPGTQEILEAIPPAMLTEKQRAKLAKLQGEDSVVVDYAEQAEAIIESIRKNLNKLFDGLYGNLNYADGMALVRDRFSELRAAFVDPYGNPYDVPQQEEPESDDDETE